MRPVVSIYNKIMNVRMAIIDARIAWGVFWEAEWVLAGVSILQTSGRQDLKDRLEEDH